MGGLYEPGGHRAGRADQVLKRCPSETEVDQLCGKRTAGLKGPGPPGASPEIPASNRRRHPI
eukprot:1485672-Lingulodinium_polyedra.AAC.1